MKYIKRIGIILIVLVIALFAVAKIYVGNEEKKMRAYPGNDEKYAPENINERDKNVLTGKKILFLGSSVTLGAHAQEDSFVDYFETIDRVKSQKEAVSGTFLVDNFSILAYLLVGHGNGNSYVHRIQEINPNQEFDAVVVQLSTNDATGKKELGEISQDGNYDVKTVTGAMEFIINYVKDTWNCPVVFYTGSYYENEYYEKMVTRLLELKEKYNMEVIDLYTNQNFNNIDDEMHDFYMSDQIHPTKAGYLEWWYPQMKKELMKVFE